MTTTIVVLGLWTLAVGAFGMVMTTRELKTDRARALRLDDSALDADGVKCPGAIGLVVALLLCLIASR